MNCDWIRQRIVSQTTTVACGGGEWRICKLGAADGIELNRMLTAMPTTGEGENVTISNPSDLVHFYSFLISKTVVDESGARTLDSNEGRSVLTNLPRDEFMALGEAVAAWTLVSQKKS